MCSVGAFAFSQAILDFLKEFLLLSIYAEIILVSKEFWGAFFPSTSMKYTLVVWLENGP